MTQTTARPPSCFFAIFLLIGLVLTIGFGYWMVWLPLRVHLFYVETTCVVLDKRLEKIEDKDGKDEPTFRPLVHIEYQVDGRPHRAWTYDASAIADNLQARQQAVLDRYEKGKRYPCWYDPAHPDRAVLVRSISPWGLMVGIPLVFVAIGAGGLIYNRRVGPPPAPCTVAGPKVPAKLAGATYGLLAGGFIAAVIAAFTLMFTFAGHGPFWLAPVLFFAPFLVFIVAMKTVGARLFERLNRTLPSPERAAAASLAPVEAEPRGADEEAAVTADAGDDWPTVPNPPDLPAGRELAWQLASSSRPGCFLLGAVAAAIFWNGIVSIFVYQAINSHLRGKPEWFLTVFMVPFVLVGLLLIGLAVVALVGYIASLLAGTVRVEIDAHPLEPGGSYPYRVDQSGVSALRNVRVMLKCTESATYTAGTSTSTATREVVRAPVGESAGSLAGGMRGTLLVPDEAMHSFEAAHNKISWTLEVRGRVAGFLPHSQEYPVIVRPAAGGSTP